MIKTSASKFKANLGKFMRQVRAGKEVLVTDRDQPVAKLVPITPSAPRPSLPVARPRDPAAPPLGEVEVRGLRHRGTDTTAWLREDRERR